MRLLLPLLLLATTALTAQTLQWRDIRDFGIEGQGWTDTKHPFDRFPAKAETLVRPAVWSLSQNSAGLLARFTSNAKSIRARWTLTKANLALPHMPATGVSGLDLYIRDPQGRYHWVGAGRPEKQTNDTALASGFDGAPHEFVVYLPLYNGVESVEIGVPAEASIGKAPARPALRPVVVYGTSITQGGCASRPAMAYPAILGRRFDWPMINLGFSGNGRNEPEVAKLLAELDPAAYVIDSLPNIGPDDAPKLVEPFIRALRAARPSTPIVLVENVTYSGSDYIAAKKQRSEGANKVLRQAYEKLIREGDKYLTYIPGGDLLGDDGEGAVDGTHPTDLGFTRMADVIGRDLAQILRAERARATTR